MAIPNKRALARPAKDEWGVYDPQQAGLAALFARLDTKDQKTAPPPLAPAARLAARTTENGDAAPSRLKPRDTE